MIRVKKYYMQQQAFKVCKSSIAQSSPNAYVFINKIIKRRRINEWYVTYN